MTAVVDKEKCVGCGRCVDVCPVEAIKVEEGMAIIEGEKCVGCGACTSECPCEAIRLE